MKSMIGLCIFLCVLVGSKKLTKNVNLESLCINPGTIFLTKFDVGMEGNFTIHYRYVLFWLRKHTNQGDFNNASVTLALLQDNNYHKFR